MNFSISESLKPVVEKWDNLLPPGHYLRSTHLLALEEAMIEDLQFRYVFFTDQDKVEPVALAYFQVIQFRSRHYKSPLLDNVLKFPENWLMRKGFRILICGNIFRIDFPGIYLCNPDISVTTLLGSFEDFFRTFNPYPHAILIKDWQKNWTMDWTKKLGYHPWPDDLTMKLNIRPEWKNFTDYTKALKHRYAQRTRSSRKRFKGVVRRELTLPEVFEFGNDIQKLYSNVVEKQFIRMVIVNSNYFIKMKETYHDNFLIFGYFMDEKLIAFSSNLVYDKLWELHYIGMDYSLNESLWLYFNILFDAVSDAISAQKDELELGRTAREAKAAMGCEPVYFTSFVRLRGSLVNWLVHRFASTFNNSTAMPYEFRHPFRDH